MLLIDSHFLSVYCMFRWCAQPLKLQRFILKAEQIIRRRKKSSGMNCCSLRHHDKAMAREPFIDRVGEVRDA